MKKGHTDNIIHLNDYRNLTHGSHRSGARRRQARARRRMARLRGAAVFALFFLILVIGISSATTQNAQASDTADAKPVYKYYTTIRVNSGDTLWDIAKTYMTDDYSSIHSYIEEVKSMNHLTSSTITDGMYLSVPYYSTEYKA